MRVNAKYVTEFTIKNGQIKGSRVLREEYATESQKAAIQSAKLLLRKFVKSRLTKEPQFADCTVNVRTSFVETTHGLELTFKV